MSKNTNLSFLTDYITADITNGRIGINNASPAYSFDVTGIARTSTSTYLATASGNVGIGTTSPKSYGALTISGQTIGLSNIAVDINQAFKFNNYYSSSAGSDKTISTGYAGSVGFDNSVGALTFSTSSSSVAADGNIVTSERMRILANGNVGIGTSSPSQKLEVNGNVKAVGAFVRDSGNIFVGSYVTVFTMDTSSSKVYLLQLVPTDSAALTNYRLFGVVQANTAAGSSGYAFVSLASQTMDVQFVGAAIQVRITNGQGYNFKWSITQLC